MERMSRRRPYCAVVAIPSYRLVRPLLPQEAPLCGFELRVPECLLTKKTYVAHARAIRLTDGARQLLAFGASGTAGQLCVDLNSGEVVERGPALGPARLVNASVDMFSRSVHSAVAAFPFYDREADDHERRRVARRMASQLGEIDSSSLLDADSFWSTFVDDLELGDYATEDIMKE